MRRRGGFPENVIEINKLANEDRTPLYAAVDPEYEDSIMGADTDFVLGSAHRRAAKLLIANGADVTKGNGKFKVTPLHWAAFKNYVDLLKMMIPTTTNIDVVDENDNTPLYLALKQGNAKAAKLLIDNGADINRERSEDQSTALHWAAAANYEFIAEFLPKVKDINKQDSDGSTALHLALEHYHTNIAKLLVANGADLDIEGTQFKTSPLYLAAWNGNYEFLKDIMPNKIETAN